MSTRLQPYPAYKESGVQWLGRIPEHWQVKRFKFFASVRNGQIDPEDRSFEDMVLVAPNHIESGTGRLLFKETAKEQGAISGKYAVKSGEIIYSKIRPGLNKATIAEHDCLCSADMYPVRVFSDFEPDFMLYFMLGQSFVKRMVDESMRVAMPKVNRDDLYNCWYPLPPRQEQKGIVFFLVQKTGQIDALIKKKKGLIELLQEKRTALITHSVTRGLNGNATNMDSGIPWLGRIPNGWKLIELRRAVDSLRPITYGIVQPGEHDQNGILMVRGQDYSTGWAQSDSIFRVSSVIELPYSRSRLLPGDIVMTIVGAGVGNIAIVPDWLRHANITQTTARIAVDTGKAENSFIAYVLQSEVGVANVRNSTRGAAQPGLTLGNVARFKIGLPPLQEQTAITSYLETEVSGLEALIAKVQTAIERLREYRTVLISAAVTGQIDVRDGQ